MSESLGAMAPMDGARRRILLKVCFAAIVLRSVASFLLAVAYAPWLELQLSAIAHLGAPLPSATVSLLQSGEVVRGSWWLVLLVEVVFLYGAYRVVDTLDERPWAVPVAVMAALLAIAYVGYLLMGVVAGEAILLGAVGTG